MSIIVAAVRAGVSLKVLSWVITIVGTLLAMGILIASRAWRPSSIRGPQRLPPDEPIGPLVFIMFGGVSLWIFVQVLMLKLLHHGVPGDQIKPTNNETVVIVTVAQVVAIAFMILGTVTRRRNGIATLGMSASLARRAIAPALAGSICVIPLVNWVAIFTEVIFDKYRLPHPQKHQLLEILDVAPAPWVRVMIVIGAVIVAPLFEEFLFRGHLQTILVRVTRMRWLAVIIASALFALVHEHWVIRIPIFALSLGFGYMYERTGNLWVSIFMHALFNGMNIMFSYFGPH